MTSMVEQRMKKKVAFETALVDVLKDVYTQHGRIVFNGDGYSTKWHKEAEKRGLLNLRTAVDAMETIVSEKNVTLFSSYGVLSAR